MNESSTGGRIFRFARDVVIAAAFLSIGTFLSAKFWPGISVFWALLFLMYGSFIILRLNISPFRTMNFSNLFSYYLYPFKKNSYGKKKVSSFFRAAAVFFVLPILLIPVFSIFFSATAGLPGVFAAMFLITLFGLYFVIVAILANVFVK